MSAIDSSILKKLFYGFIGLVILIQLVPVDRTNPAVVSEPQWDSPKTKAYAERVCFDCHSNQTKWPWYSYIAPASWFVIKHVNDGRDEFNMSEYKAGDGFKAAKEVREGKMPLTGYVPFHPEANLTEEEKQEFINGLKLTFKKADKETDSPTTESEIPEKTE